MTSTKPNDSHEKPEELSFIQRLDRELNWVLDPNHVIDITMDWVMRRTAAQAGLIATRNGDYLQVVRVIGAGPNNVERLTREPWPIASGAISRVIQDADPLYVPDCSAMDAPAPIILPRTKSMLSQPLIVKDEVIGVLHLESPEEDYFAPEMQEFVKHVAERAALALKNASLLTYTKDSEQLKSDMIRMLAHDLRNPLNTITSAVHLARRADDLSALVKTSIDTIENAANQIQMLIEEMLTLEKLEANVELSHEPVNLVLTLKEAVDRMQSSVERKGHKLVIESPTEEIYTRGELTFFRQAMINLISNAVKYTPPEGRVVVRMEQLGAKIFFSVKDNGYGIPKDKQQYLFQRFYRAPDTAQIQGTGLGLSLVKAIVERAEGEVWFESEPDVGSTFGFWVPVADKKLVQQERKLKAQTDELEVVPSLYDEVLQRRRLRQSGQSWQ
ncbi:MAG: GAF domain-containing sensor histidine kinase [Chloroflexi bacterium]|nr:GAF domain-containing sensor histidine kinase [Chloroflexota bacterium]